MKQPYKSAHTILNQKLSEKSASVLNKTHSFRTGVEHQYFETINALPDNKYIIVH